MIGLSFPLKYCKLRSAGFRKYLIDKESPYLEDISVPLIFSRKDIFNITLFHQQKDTFFKVWTLLQTLHLSVLPCCTC